jgi:PAS domain S-box-containing protein
VEAADSGQDMRAGTGTKGSSRRTRERDGDSSDAWQRLALESMDEGVVAMDATGRIIGMNAAGERLTGCPDSFGRPHAEVLRIHDRDTGQPLPSPVDRILAGATGADLDERSVLTCENGVEHAIEGRAVPLRNGTETIGVVITFHDATNRRLEEAEVGKLFEQLRESLRLQELFSTMLGHDLRTPLGAIIMSAQVLMRAGSEASAASARRILHSGRRMSRMIDQLLDFTRLRSSSGIPLRPVAMNIGDTCRQVVEELKPGHAGRAVVVECGGDLSGTWDPNRLRQVITTVFGNALDHGAPEGRVTVRLDGKAADHVVLMVENDGEVPATVLPILFDPFRSVRELRKKAQGLGLGLHLCQAILRRHGGSLAAACSEGRTRMTARLPRTCGAFLPHT